MYIEMKIKNVKYHYNINYRHQYFKQAKNTAFCVKKKIYIYLYMNEHMLHL